MLITYFSEIINDTHIKECNDIFERLIKINIPPQLEIKILKSGCEQQMIYGLKFKDIFDEINKKHFHRSEDGQITPHSESLYDHLKLAGLLSYIEAQYLGYSKKEQIHAYLLGLFHDIGKPATMHSNKISRYVSFKGHSIVGSIILSRLWTNKLFEEFELSFDDWSNIISCTCAHMCSYFSKQTTPLHEFGVKSMMNFNARKLLIALRFGDHLACIP